MVLDGNLQVFLGSAVGEELFWGSNLSARYSIYAGIVWIYKTYDVLHLTCRFLPGDFIPFLVAQVQPHVRKNKCGHKAKVYVHIGVLQYTAVSPQKLDVCICSQVPRIGDHPLGAGVTETWQFFNHIRCLVTFLCTHSVSASTYLHMWPELACFASVEYICDLLSFI